MTNILFLCAINKCRSPTAEWIYSKNTEYSVASAGINKKCENRVDLELLTWADRIFVMERKQRNSIRKEWPNVYREKTIECLYIPDEYAYMDQYLIEILTAKLMPHLGTPARKIRKEIQQDNSAGPADAGP